MNLVIFSHTEKGKYIKNVLIGVGASVVLMGALFKIQHWNGAGAMLTAGMITEAIIFALLGILPPPKDYYWERYYPNLDHDPEVEAYLKGVKYDSGGGKAAKSLDQMLEDANINPAVIKKLSDNFQRFGNTVEQIKDISDVTAATNVYSSSAREAAEALGQMKTTFQGATSTMNVFNSAADDTAKFHEQVVVLSRNLGTLNGIYEVELQDANNHLKAMNKFYSNLVSASDAMASSATDAVAAKEQIALLSKNLTVLNQVYGNMLSAMQGR